MYSVHVNFTTREVRIWVHHSLKVHNDPAVVFRTYVIVY